MPFGDIGFSGYWDASANRVKGRTGPGLFAQRDGAVALYKVIVAGTTQLDAVTSWNVGDFAYYNGFEWSKISGGSSSASGIGASRNVAYNVSDGSLGSLGVGLGASGAALAAQTDSKAPQGFRRTYLTLAVTLVPGQFASIDYYADASYNRYPCVAGDLIQAAVCCASDLPNNVLQLVFFDSAGNLATGGVIAGATVGASSQVGGDVDTYANRPFVIGQAPASAVSYFIRLGGASPSNVAPGATLGASALLTGKAVSGQTTPSPFTFPRVPTSGQLAVGIINDGVGDARNGLSIFDGARSTATMELVPGTYRIASNITFSSRPVLPRGVMLKPDNGVVVTFTIDPDAQLYPIFDLSAGGSIAGLQVAELDWFLGLKDTGQDCFALTQKALNSLVNNGTLWLGVGRYTYSGGLLIADRGQNIKGRGRYSTFIMWNTTSTNFIKFTNTGGGYAPEPSISDIGFAPTSQSVRATSGIAIFCDSVGAGISNISMNGAWDGIIAQKGSRIDNVNMAEGRNTGLFCIGSNDLFFNRFIIASLSDTVYLTSVIGVFQPGEQITFSDAPYMGTLYFNLGGGRYRCNLLSGGAVTPVPGTTQITGVSSGAKGTVSQVDYDYQSGAIRWQNGTESMYIMQGDCIGGLYPFLSDGSGLRGGTPGFSRLTDVFLDSAHNGGIFQKMGHVILTNCWSYNHGNNALEFDQTASVKAHFCDIGGSRGYGISIRSNNKNVQIAFCSIFLNTVGGIATTGTGNDDMDLVLNKFNSDFALPGAVQPFAIQLNSGFGTSFRMKDNSGRGLLVGANAFRDLSGVAAANKDTSGNMPATVFT